MNSKSSSENVKAILEGIAPGEKAIVEGKIIPQSEARRRMSRWLKRHTD